MVERRRQLHDACVQVSICFSIVDINLDKKTYENLLVAIVVTCNTAKHPSCWIGVTNLLDGSIHSISGLQR